MSTNVRNILIVVAIAALVATSSTVGLGARAIYALLSLLILVGLLYFAWTYFRENRHRVEYLPGRDRAILYGAAGLLVVLLLVQFLVPLTALGAIVVLALMIGCGYAIYRVLQEAGRYY